jgi:hypothetical protein
MATQELFGPPESINARTREQKLVFLSKLLGHHASYNLSTCSFASLFHMLIEQVVRKATSPVGNPSHMKKTGSSCTLYAAWLCQMKTAPEQVQVDTDE